ncbi:MAG: hypothetical protein AAFV80_23520 [Bacteroidota bacterium]
MKYSPVEQFPFYWCRFNEPIDTNGKTIQCKLGKGVTLYRMKVVHLKTQAELVMQSAEGQYRFTIRKGWGGFSWQIRKGKRSISADRFSYDPWMGFYRDLNYYVKKTNTWNNTLRWQNKPMEDIMVFQARTQKEAGQRFFEFYFDHTGIGSTDLDCLVGLSYLIFMAKIAESL